jgi:hypothetical protein
MRITGIDPEFLPHTSPQTRMGQHAFDGMLDYLRWISLHYFL